MTPLVDRVLKFLENPNAGNDFREYYELPDGIMDADEIDSSYDVSFTNHTFQTFENKKIFNFFESDKLSLDELETIEEKKTKIKEYVKVFTQLTLSYKNIKHLNSPGTIVPSGHVRCLNGC